MLPTGTPPPADRPGLGITYMLLGMLFFSAMDGVAKWIVVVFPLMQVLALRNGMNLVLISPIVYRAGGWRSLRTGRPWAHGMRVLLSLGALTCYFEALRHLPLATCVALAFASPLFMTLFSVVLLKEKVGWHRWGAIAVGFIGVLVIVQPETDQLATLAAGLAILSSVFFALNMTTVRWLARHETEAAILFHQNLGVALICGAALPFVWVTPTPLEWLGIAAMAVTMTGGQILTVKAFRIAPVGVVAPFEYVELIGASLIGYLVWKEIPADHVWLGAGIIIASGLYMIWRETGKKTNTNTEKGVIT